MPSFFSYATALALAASSAIAAPALDKRASCTFSGTTGAAALVKGKSACKNIVLSGLVVPAGTTLDLTKLAANTIVTFEGTTTFGYKEWVGPLVSVSGSGIQVIGATGSVLDGQGARWWDGKGTNGGKTKPKFFYAHSLTNSKITGITIKNSPVQVFSINDSSNLVLDHITIDNKDGDAGGGHNTDAFDVGSSTNIEITNPTVHNQDDCLAINSGTGITFTGAYCSGGHGISIGSVGGRSDNVVKSVTISNSQVVNSQNGIRIKTIYGATGSVSGVTYSGITLTNISKYGVVIEQDYENGSPKGVATTGVPITDVSISKVTGSMASSATPVYILCGKGSCSGWKWEGNSITGGKKSTSCSNVPSGVSC